MHEGNRIEEAPPRNDRSRTAFICGLLSIIHPVCWWPLVTLGWKAARAYGVDVNSPSLWWLDVVEFSCMCLPASAVLEVCAVGFGARAWAAAEHLPGRPGRERVIAGGLLGLVALAAFGIDTALWAKAWKQ
jgi:hypothetical protein